MSENQNNTDVQIQNALQAQAKENHGILSLVLSFFLAQIGGVICWRVFGKRSVGYCVLWFLVYTVLEAIAGALIIVIVGAVLLPIIWIVIMVHTYKVSVNPLPQVAE